LRVHKDVAAGIFVVALAVLTACGTTGDDTATVPPSSTAASPARQSTQSPPASVVAPFMAMVDNAGIGGACAATDCWHPTQFGPKLVKNESVSLKEITADDGTVLRPGWPNNGDRVEVLCTKKGSVYRDTAGTPINMWYGVRIPTAKMEPGSKNDPRIRKAPDGNGYLGFIGASWLVPDGWQDKKVNKPAPAC
jgi:hypothetical protein